MRSKVVAKRGGFPYRRKEVRKFEETQGEENRSQCLKGKGGTLGRKDKGRKMGRRLQHVAIWEKSLSWILESGMSFFWGTKYEERSPAKNRSSEKASILKVMRRKRQGRQTVYDPKGGGREILLRYSLQTWRSLRPERQRGGARFTEQGKHCGTERP